MKKMSERDQRDLKIMMDLRPKVARVKRLSLDGSEPREMAEAMQDMVRHMPANFVLRMINAHRAMILGNAAMREIESAEYTVSAANDDGSVPSEPEKEGA